MEGNSTKPTIKTEKVPIVVSSMKANYLDTIDVKHFPVPEIKVQSLNITLDEDTSISTDMVVSVGEETSLHDEDDEDMKHMPGKRKSRFYMQKFRKSWKDLPQFLGWLSEGNGPDKAFCTACNRELTAGKSELLKHASTKKHKKKFQEQQSSTIVNHGDPQELTNVIVDAGLTTALRFVDLRSDLVTRPSRAMKEAMFNAPYGDGYFVDPTINALENKVAELLNKEAAMYVPSGTMANLICVLTHCWGRGSEVIIGDESHLHIRAQGGIAQIGNVYPRPIRNFSDGTFSLSEVRSLIQREDFQWPVTTLVCIENTHNMKGGKALPLEWLDELGDLCHELNVPVHMDGARLMNAAVALGTSPSRLVAYCDSVAFCLNKGLGAPMGSLVVGTKEFIARALKLRKALGGNLLQCGMMAAAGIYGLDHVGPRLSSDHSHARALAQSVSEEHSSAISVDLKSVQTNILFLHCDKIRVDAKQLCQRLESIPERELEDLGESIVVMTLPITDSVVRLMTHCDVLKEDVKAVIKKLKYIIQEYDNMVYLEYKVNV